MEGGRENRRKQGEEIKKIAKMTILTPQGAFLEPVGPQRGQKQVFL